MSAQTEVTDEDIATPAHKLRQTAKGRALLAQSGRGGAAAQRYAQRDRGERQTKWKAKRFVAWDGEGITDRLGRHRYVMLGNSYGEDITNAGGIQTADALAFMLDTAERDALATHVIYAGGYDANMILLPTLQMHQARILADTGRVTLKIEDKRYRITYHPRHTFEISEETWNDEQQKLVRHRYMCLWDVFGSFQASFVKACNRTLSDEELTELAHIERMKERRGSFTVSDMAEMRDYMHAELRALVHLCRRDAEGFEAAGFQATRWDGAGAKASAVLRAKGVGDHMRKTPDDMDVPVRGGYAGGRIETYRFGQHDGPMFTVDIRSAYPWAATFLPCLKHGYWERVGNIGPDTDDEFSVWHVVYKGSSADALHPLFWRAEDGRIAYPQHTEGWYWAPEVRAAQAFADGTVKVIDGYVWRSTCNEQPFSFIPQLFHARQKLEAAMKGRGWPLKLALNSLYGKMAQQVGSKDGKPPRWHQLEWAGWITSKCRSVMFSIAAQNAANLVCIQTDGLTFTGEPTPDVLAVEGTRLGDLEVQRYDAGTFVQSGIYWLHDDEGWHDPKVRGVGAGVLTREPFLAEWESRNFGEIPVFVTRFRGLVTSSLSEERWQDWCQWIQEPRAIASAPAGKRIHHPSQCNACQHGLAGLHSTLPTGGGSKSCLHSLAWRDSMGLTTSNEWWLDSLDTEDSTEE